MQLMDGKPLNRNDMFIKSTLVECCLLDEEDQVCSAPPSIAGPVASLVNDLNLVNAQNEKFKKNEVISLQT